MRINFADLIRNADFARIYMKIDAEKDFKLSINSSNTNTNNIVHGKLANG